MLFIFFLEKDVHNFDVFFFPICGFPCINIGLLYVLEFEATVADEPQETLSSKGCIVNKIHLNYSDSRVEFCQNVFLSFQMYSDT